MEEQTKERTMLKALTGALLGLSLIVIGVPADAASKEPKYVGAKKCKSCHKKELIGNQYKAWAEAKHAGAFESLASDEALKEAKEAGITTPPQEAEECLKCHATAAIVKAEELAKKPLKMTDGVQCESCHGPGSLYRKKKVMADHDKSVAAGLVIPDEEVCLKCHNDESPSWDPKKYELADGSTAGFDFDQAAEEIAHMIPEDVKGKYIEIEKKRKAEKKARGEADDDEDDE